METFIALIAFIHTTQKKLERYERVCNDHDYCYVEIPAEDNKILKYNHGESSVKAPAITSCENNPEKSYTEKKTKHTRSGYSLFANCLFESTKKQT